MNLEEKIAIDKLDKKERILINKFKLIEKKSFNFNKNGFLKKKILNHSLILRKEIERILRKKFKINFNKLENLHNFVPSSKKNYIVGGNKITTSFYNALDGNFYKRYYNFIKELKKIFKFRFLYQIVPTIRIPCPGGMGREFFPFYHSDLLLGHPFKIINIWLPLTKKHHIEGNTFRLLNLEKSLKIYKDYNFDFEKLSRESLEHKKSLLKYFEQNSFDTDVNLGEMIIFDPRCIHAAVAPNYKTRVSIDIRIYPLKDYKNEKYIFRGTGRKKILFDLKNSYNLI